MCRCWVLQRPLWQALALRRGAHNITCPAWRESGDPVDRMNDRETELLIAGTPAEAVKPED